MIRAAPLRRHVASCSSIQQHTLRSAVSRSLIHAQIPQRFASTTSGPNARSSWKSFFVRLGLAGGAVYYYNTSPIFGNEPAQRAPPTLDSLAPKRTQSSAQQTTTSAIPSDIPTEPTPPSPTEGPSTGDPAALEAEASQQGAFNEETGEINWDCPCLGGMAYGPCGPQFREAFSCFVFSEADPKGMDCVDKFKAMQDCFRAHPDVYGAELEGDDEEDEARQQQAPQPTIETEKRTDQSTSQAQSNAIPSTYIDEAKEKLADAGEAVKSKALEVRDAVQDKASETASAVRSKTQEVREHADHLTKETQSTASDAKDAIANKAESTAHKVEEKATKSKDPRFSA